MKVERELEVKVKGRKEGNEEEEGGGGERKVNKHVDRQRKEGGRNEQRKGEGR